MNYSTLPKKKHSVDVRVYFHLNDKREIVREFSGRDITKREDEWRFF